ncbi:hypothetical protein N7931_10040 [Catenovulum sp. 2E275]|uniref:hypothetical protein n=1 Tax=Catenovulum sp. 2E275 TaxID=2980497 RepID=UPI0021D39A7E|nr:hypothetical protein [Catenovulum sp. 2E275]MCU4675975.1 hypothetical protein [Catenovulum sp. 2E275]
MKKIILTCIISSFILVLSACQSTQKKAQFSQQDLQQKVSLFLKTYAFREDFELFLSFYAADAVIEDVIRGEQAVGSKAIKTYLNWEDPDFSLGRSASHLVTEQISFDQNKAIIQGYFMPFIYQGVQLGPWRFTTILEFNDELKISKQTDWVNYTPKVIFNNSPNSNLKLKIPKYYFKTTPEQSSPIE